MNFEEKKAYWPVVNRVEYAVRVQLDVVHENTLTLQKESVLLVQQLRYVTAV